MNTVIIPSTDEDDDSTSEVKNDCFQGLAVTEPVCKGPRETSTLHKTFVAQTGKSTCVKLYPILTSRKFAALQLLWLLVCLSSFLYYASMQLYVAIENEWDENKPEKLAYVTDYGAEDSSRENKMLYIYISFWAHFRYANYDYDNYSYGVSFEELDYETRMKIEEAANNSLDELYDLQNFSATASIYYHENYKTSTWWGQDNTGILEEVEVGHGQLSWWGFNGYFRLKLLPPRKNSNWEVVLLLDLDWFTSNNF